MLAFAKAPGLSGSGAPDLDLPTALRYGLQISSPAMYVTLTF
jgi:hypothetical protein